MINLLGILHRNEDRWEELRRVLSSTQPGGPGAWIQNTEELIHGRRPGEPLQQFYLELVRRLLEDSSCGLNHLQTKGGKQRLLDPLDRFLRIKLKLKPKLNLSVTCHRTLKEQLGNLVEVRFFCSGSRKCVVVPLTADPTLLSELRIGTLRSAGRNLCETDLAERGRFQVFRMNFRLENLTSCSDLRQQGAENRNLDRISVVSVFETKDDLDVGTLSLFFVKFFSEYLIHSLT